MPKFWECCFKMESKNSKMCSYDTTDKNMEILNGDLNCPFNSESVPLKSKNGNVNCNNNATGDVNGKTGKPNLRLKLQQPVRLKNHMFLEEYSDSLHLQELSIVDTKCTAKLCQGSLVDTTHQITRTTEEVYKEAESFLKQYFLSIGRENTKAHTSRLDEVKYELNENGFYQLKNSELIFGAKLAWRNSVRCIGRIQWKKLQVFDCREVTTATGMFEALCNHIKYATNKGNIRSAITIFPQRTDGKHDYRIWNPQLITYAGYKQSDGTVLGDAGRVEFTEVCIKLGWKPPRTAWDILPLVLSVDGKDPEYFDIPREIIMEVEFEHPQFEWFKDLGLRWYALPAVSNMKLDCGGIEFTGTAFNGWYMGTEIGCRNLCDVTRLNITETVAVKMGLDTCSYVSLWKDQVLVEINKAVLYSFHRDNASIVDHHSASEQFMKHLENENKTRGGCPADWVWIVPPMSSSLTAVFHQEMALYYMNPSYGYQDPAWKTHQWTKSEDRIPHRKFHFKQIARAVKFTSKLFTRALSKRIKATILYATETGKSEQYAKELGTIFGHAFNVQVHCMSDYDMFSIEHENLLLIVTSTFGNGEPPANGTDFAEHLFQLLYNEKKHHNNSGEFSSSSVRVPTPKSLIRTTSLMSPSIEYKRQLTRVESNKSSVIGASSIEHIGPLSNIHFSVFALGSSAYPKFCNFGKTVDKIMGDLGGERLLEINFGDEMYGQEQQFRLWSSNIFHVACETFCLDENDMVKDAKKALVSLPLTEDTVRFAKTQEKISLKSCLELSSRKQLTSCKTVEVKNLGDNQTDRITIFVNLLPEKPLSYEPGDHLGVMPCNRKEIVDVVLDYLKDVDDYDKIVQLQVMKEILSLRGSVKSWERHETTPPVSVRDLFTRFLDITTPPSTKILHYLSSTCTDVCEKNELMQLATDSNKYDDWRNFHFPHLAEVLLQFPSSRPRGSLLAALLPRLQPRFYSISSSPLAHNDNIHATVSVVFYNTQNDDGPLHYGVCSTYLQDQKPNDEVFIFIRRAQSFHMPKDISVPIILVGPGSGIAPFRGFWNHRKEQMKTLKPLKEAGPMYLFFGCRNKSMDLYRSEKEQMVQEGVLTKTMVAFSRENNEIKKHVQSLLDEEGSDIARMLVDEDGHFYVCGDCKMAEEVMQKLKQILKDKKQMTDLDVENFILNMMDENRYHEDIFGITLRTAEVHKSSRENAKRTRQESAQSLP